MQNGISNPVEDLLHESSRSTPTSAGIRETADIKAAARRATSKIMAGGFVSIAASRSKLRKPRQLKAFCHEICRLNG